MVGQIDVVKEVCSSIPTQYGKFELCLYSNNYDEKEHLAYILGDVNQQHSVLVRVHSECFTGDVLGSMRCDCGEQLNNSLAMISQKGAGVLVYMRQEGRGIGLKDKLRAYNLQDEGYDTIDANLALGHQADNRDYTVTAEILRDLGVKSIQLLTNNPQKIDNLRSHGIEVSERIKLQPTINPNNEKYIRTKVSRMNHWLDLPPQTEEVENYDNGAE